MQRVDVKTIGHRAGGAGHGRADPGERNRDLRVLDRAGVEKVADQREAIEAALVGGTGAVLEGVPDRPETADVIDDPLRGVRELGGEAALDVGPHLGAEPEQQAPTARALQVPCGLRQDERAAPERDRDGRSQAHARGRERRGEQRQEGIVCGLVAPQAIDPQPLVSGRFGAERAQIMAAQAHVDLHVTSLPDRGREM